MSTVSEYGSWKSPLSGQLASDSSISIKRLYVDSHNPERVYWTELHPHDNGRTVVLSQNVEDASAKAVPWLREEYSAADTVHEYGGAAFFANSGSLFFMNPSDNKIYKQAVPYGPATQVTHGPGTYYRYGDADFSKNPNFFFCVREDHSGEATDPNAECVNTLISVNVHTGDETVVASGNDFYTNPRVSPDGTKLCWMTWIHPNMPWDSTEIWVGDLSFTADKVTVINQKKVAGEEGVNFMEPQWTCDNKLMYIADPTGWWNLYLVSDLNTMAKTNIWQKNEEIGDACWDLGYRSYSPSPSNKDIVAILYGKKPSILTISSGQTVPIDIPKSYASSCVFQPDGNYLYIHAVNPVEPECVLKYNLNTKTVTILHHSADQVVGSDYMSVPEHVEFLGPTGKQAYGYYYAPKNPDFKAPENTLPPLLIKIHGGPTGAASLALDLNKQYFTSRGIAILDVNYRGSTGYGTAFRNELKGNWGVYDIEDTTAAAVNMATDNKADSTKLLTSGGSAGGYTTLADLVQTVKTFAAGASYYGISNMVTLAEDTHKFESHYADTLIAPYPQEIEIYEERSPINHLDEFETPCAFFQGALDQVVPPDQSKEMFDAIDQKGIPCAYVLFPDEAHGFEKAENKQKALDGEFYFYSQILGFTPADEGIEIPIENLD